MEILRTIDMNEEVEIKAMQKRQRELHLIPTPICYLDVEVLNKNGEITAKYSDRSKSWVRNFYNIVTCQQLGISAGINGTTYGEGKLSIKSILGNVRTDTIPCAGGEFSASYVLAGGNQYVNSAHRGAASNTNIGIVVGTGDTAESFDDYSLTNIIANGVSTGQMQYQEMSALNGVWDGDNNKFIQTVERYFINNSGGSITVKESGIYSCIFYKGMSSPVKDHFMLARDVLSTPVAVAHESQIKVTYTIQIAYPS